MFGLIADELIEDGYDTLAKLKELTRDDASKIYKINLRSYNELMEKLI